MTITNEQYPLSTQDGQSIPLDVIRPVGMVWRAFTNSAWTSITIPEGAEMATLKATENCYIDLGNTVTVDPIAGTYYPNMLFVPSGFVVSIVLLPSTIKVRSATAGPGNLYVQLIGKWATLSLPRQSSTVISRR